MTFCLDTTIIKPADDKEIKNAIILLHGYGGDGKDISMLSLIGKDIYQIQYLFVQMVMKHVLLIHQGSSGLI